MTGLAAEDDYMSCCFQTVQDCLAVWFQQMVHVLEQVVWILCFKFTLFIFNIFCNRINPRLV